MQKKKIIKEIFSASAIAQDYEFVTERGSYFFEKQEDDVKKYLRSMIFIIIV